MKSKSVFVYLNEDDGVLEVFQEWKDAIDFARRSNPDEEDAGDEFDGCGVWSIGEYGYIACKEIR